MIHLRSPREISLMREAGLVVWKAHQIAKELVRPGVTTGELDAAIEACIEEAGATPLFKGVPGVVPFPAVSCISVNEEVVHGIPGPRVLKEGDVVSIDIGARLNGWCGDSAFTHPVGEIDAKARKLLDVTKEVLDLAIAELGKRQRWSEVARAMEAKVKTAGFHVVQCFVGHGIGRELHEEPQVPNFINAYWIKHGDFDLQPGLVIAVEPMVNMGTRKVKGLSDHWTQATADGLPSAHFEHTLALTSEGVQILTGPPSTA